MDVNIMTDVPMNNAMPDHPGWTTLQENWNQICTESTIQQLVLPGPDHVPGTIRSLVKRAYIMGKASLRNPECIDFSAIYPAQVTDLQREILDDALSLGQGLAIVFTPAPAASAQPLVSAPVVAPATASVRPPRLADPDKFDGTRSKFRNFATQLQLHFSSNPAAYLTENSRIVYAASFLTGNAYTWFSPYINPDTGAVSFKTFTSFLSNLRAAFDDPDSYATAERDLESLKQDSSCAGYYAKMVSLFSQLGWTEDKVQIHHFRRGLKSSVKDALVGKEMSDNFSAFATTCISLDNDLYARILEKKHEPIAASSSRPASRLTAPVASRPVAAAAPQNTPASDPMDLDNSEAGRAKRKAYRLTNNLCLYCGQAGHAVRNCPRIAARAQIAEASVQSSGEPSSEIVIYDAKNPSC